MDYLGDFSSVKPIILGLIILFGMILALFWYKKQSSKQFIPFPKKYDLKDIDIQKIDQMSDGFDFEVYLYRLFIALGYKNTYKTTRSRDFGADLVFTDRQGERVVIQAKRYAIDHSVGISAVQEIYSSMRYYRAKKSIVITSSKYTDSCETLAGINRVKLIDRNDLINIIDYFKKGLNEKAKDTIEADPREILVTWSELDNFDSNKIIKKDRKAERLVTR